MEIKDRPTKMFIFYENKKQWSKRSLKLELKSLVNKIQSNIKKLDERIVRGTQKAVGGITKYTGKGMSYAGKAWKRHQEKKTTTANHLGDEDKKNNISKRLSGFLTKGGDYVQNRQDRVENAVGKGFDKFSKGYHWACNKGGEYILKITKKIFKNMTPEQEEKMHRYGNIFTAIALPGSASALGIVLLTMDADTQGLEDLAQADPIVLEAMARGLTDITEESTSEEIAELLNKYETEASLNGFISNTKGIMGEMMLVEHLNEMDTGITYELYPTTNHELFDIRGMDENNELVENIQVKMVSEPDKVKELLKTFPEDGIIYVNSELAEQLDDPRVMVAPISEQSLEDRIIASFSKIKGA